MNKKLVFVYGTLRKGEYNHSLLERADLVSLECWTHGKLYDTGKGYPCMTLEHQYQVLGELYAVTDQELYRLDQLEGYVGPGKNNDYERIYQSVYTTDQEYRAYLYIYSNERAVNLIPIELGDWKKRI